MLVILTKNIFTELRLPNGTTGIVRSIPFHSKESAEGGTGIHRLWYSPEYTVAEMDKITLKPLNGLESNHVPIFAMDGSFSIKLERKISGLNETTSLWFQLTTAQHIKVRDKYSKQLQ